MTILSSQVDTRSDIFKRNAQAMRGLVDDLRRRTEQVRLGGGPESRKRHVARGKLLPRDRVETALRTVYRTNVCGFAGGRMGAVNGMRPDGTVDASSEQRNGTNVLAELPGSRPDAGTVVLAPTWTVCRLDLGLTTTAPARRWCSSSRIPWPSGARANGR